MPIRTPLVLLLIFLSLSRIHADVLTVSNLLDDVENPPPGSLRKTVADAKSGDTIDFALSVTGTIALAGAELVLDKDVSIQGPGASALAISGDQRSRIIRVPAGITATISGLTMRDGKAPRGTDAAGVTPPTAGGPGGAVYNSGTLTVLDCVLTNNAAGAGGDRIVDGNFTAGPGGHGGGIANAAGILTLRKCVVSNNKAGAGGMQSSIALGGNGGGLSNIDGTMILVDCFVTGNLAGPGSKGGDGGGVFCDGGTAQLTRCTLHQNKPGFGSGYINTINTNPAPGGVGGGIAIAKNTITEINTSTISGNICGESEIYNGWPLNNGRYGTRGAGIHTQGTLSIISSTICSNIGRTAEMEFGSEAIGAGLFVDQGTALLKNSIIAGNSGHRFSPDIGGAVMSAGHNLISVFDSRFASGITPGTNGDKAGAYGFPLQTYLGPLTAVGTCTPVHPLHAYSPAIDAGDDQLTDADQRGTPRPIGAHVDIGAVEAEAIIEFASSATTFNEGQGTVAIGLVRSASTSGPASAQYSIAGTAIDGADFTISGSISFGPGETQKTLSLTLVADTAAELSETIELSLNTPSTGTTIGPKSSHVVQINDDDGTGKIAFASAASSIIEGAQKAVVSVTRTDGSAGQLSVAFQTTAGTAGSSDFTSVSGTLTFAPGVTEQTIDVAILDDGTIESLESFTVTLSAISGGGALVDPKAHTVSIQDDDAPAILQFASSASTTPESGNATITVTRGGNTLRAVSAGYQTSDWSATVGSDYTKKFGSVSFPAGVTEQTITVPIVEDSVLEGDETFQIKLTSLSAYAELGSLTTHTVTILNNDEGRPPEMFAVTDKSDNPQTPAAGSLRQLVANAQYGDTITFEPAVTGEISLGGAQIVIDKKITLIGPGAEILALSGNDVSRLFEVKASGSLAISGLTLRKGKATDGMPGVQTTPATAGEPGGAILSSGDVMLADCIIENNTAGHGGDGVAGSGANGGHGGAIASFGNLALTRCVLTDNRAGNGGDFYWSLPFTGGVGGDGGNGGAVASMGGSVKIVDCSIERNAAGDGGTGYKTAGSQVTKQGRGGSGGGVFAAGTFSIVTSTLAQNRAGLTPLGYMAADNVDKASNGGGLAISTGATGQLQSSTISGNLAGDVYAPNYGSTSVRGGGGGGIYNGGALGMTSCTVTDNETGAALGIAGGTGAKFFSGDGGGILSRGVLTLRNSAIASNRVSEKRPPDNISFLGSGPDVNGAFSDAGHNFIFGDPKLSLLEHYGGLTKTHALLPGSPLLDAGDDTLTGLDQRGYPRLVGARVDIGAVEWEPIAANSVAFSTNTVEVAETAGSITLNVTRSGSTSEALDVGYSTVAKTATPDSDFIATSGILHFDAGQTEATFAISILDSPGVEPPETFDVLLSTGGVGALVYPRGKETITIFDDDGPGTFVFASASSTVAENAGSVQLSILRKNGAVGTASVSYSPMSLPSGTVTFAPGVTQQTITIPIQDNSTYEGTRSVPVDLNFPSLGASLGNPSRHTLTITDDDFPAFSFALAASEVLEGGGFVAITVKSTNAPAPVTVTYSTIGGTAEANSDFTAKSGTLQFTAGTSQKTLIIPIVNDSQVEDPETFTVTLSAPSSGMTLGTSTHTITIVDTDVGGFSFPTVQSQVGEGQSASIVVQCTNAPGPVTVNYSTSAGSAQANADFTATNGTLQFAAGTSQATLTIPILNDSISENAENFTVTLSSPSNGMTLSGSSIHTVTIVDGTALPTVGFETEQSSVSESGGVAHVIVKRAGNTALAAQVRVTVSGGTATAGADFALASNNITFAPGVTEQSVVIYLTDDLVTESSKMCVLTLQAIGANTVLGQTTDHIMTIVDDDALEEATKGSFAGILEHEPSGFRGAIAVNTTGAGRVSGIMRVDGRTVRFKGVIPADGLFSHTFAQIINTHASWEGTIRLRFLEGGDTLGVSFEQIGNTPMRGVAKRAKIGTRTNPVPEANAYTAIIGDNTPDESAGFLRFVVQGSGRTTFLGKTADGVTLRASSQVAVDGSISLYVDGQIGGSLLSNATDPTQYDSDVRALRWNGGTYPQVELQSAVYRPPGRARILDDFDVTSGAARIVITGPELTPMESALTWNTDNSLRSTTTTPLRPRVKLQPKTGILRGTFADETGRTRHFWGACLQRPDAHADVAAGFSLLRQGNISVPVRVSLLPAN